MLDFLRKLNDLMSWRVISLILFVAAVIEGFVGDKSNAAYVAALACFAELQSQREAHLL